MDLPQDFVSYLDFCKSLMDEVWCYKKSREGFIEFENVLAQRDIEFAKKQNRQRCQIQFPLLAQILTQLAKRAKNAKKKPITVSQHYHLLACSKTLLEIKQSLSLYTYGPRSFRLCSKIVVTTPSACGGICTGASMSVLKPTFPCLFVALPLLG